MYPKVNEIFYFHIDSDDDEKGTVVYKSRLSDMDEDSFLIELPMNESNGRLKKVYFGDELSVEYITEGGIKHYFNSYVLGFKEDVIRMVRIHKPHLDDISKIQRRSYFRVNANLEIAIKKENNMRFITHTEDVSGGAISFFSESKYSLKEGDILSCWVLIPYKNGSVEHVPFTAELVRVRNSDQNRNIAILKFTKIYHSERQKLIRYCFEREMEFRNR